MRKPIKFQILVLFSILVSASFAYGKMDPAASSPSDSIISTGGETIYLPVPPGFTRVDGLSPEIDRIYKWGTSEGGIRAAMFVSDTSNWEAEIWEAHERLVKFLELGRARAEGEIIQPPPFDVLYVYIDDLILLARRHVNYSVPERVEANKQILLKNHAPNASAFGDIPDTYLVSLTPAKGGNTILLRGMTYLKGSFVSIIYEPSSQAKEEVKAHEEKLLNWTLELRRKNSPSPE